MAFEPIDGLAQLADRYDGFILDIWGVLMDGVAPYPGAAETLSELQTAGKQVLLLSNAPRVPAMVAERLSGMNMPPALYSRIVSSGGASRDALERKAGAFADFGDRYFFIGPDRDLGLLDGLDYRRCDSPGTADFLLNVGPFEDTDTIEDFDAILKQGVRRRLPMVCANPDIVIVRQNGDRVLCAGAIAEAYEALGGTVHSFGKPYQPIYDYCLAAMPDIAVKRIVAVGDNLDTDIAGASNAGIDTVLVTGGVLAETLETPWGEAAPLNRVKKICDAKNQRPNFYVPIFRWS